MSDDFTNTSWSAALARYDSFLESGWQHIADFREFVSDLGRSPEAAGLTVFTSHETLVISPYTRTPDAFEGRHVRLHPLRDGRVRIQKVPAQFDRGGTEDRTVPLADAKANVLMLPRNL